MFLKYFLLIYAKVRTLNKSVKAPSKLHKLHFQEKGEAIPVTGREGP
jgi:hypothetical protein